jgi:hypothetical protein
MPFEKIYTSRREYLPHHFAGGREEGEGLVFLEKPYKLSEYGSVCTYVSWLKPDRTWGMKGVLGTVIQLVIHLLKLMLFFPTAERLKRGGSCWLLKLRKIGTPGVHMKGVLSWLFRWAPRVETRGFVLPWRH